MSDKVPSLLGAIAQMKCPQCRKGNMFTHKSIFPLSKLQAMPDKCPNCGQKMELEPGFYYGTGYVSYAICIALSIFNLVWYWVLIGLSVHDNSMFIYLAVNIAIILVLLPWIVRYSRVLYLNMFVKYGSLGEKNVEQ